MTNRQNPVAVAALGVAVLSLLVALSGGVYAAAKIDGSDLKNRSVAGKKIKNDTLTGKQINEATLALPSSAPAGNFKRVRFEQTVTAGSASKSVLSVGTLQVVFLCSLESIGWRLSASSSGGPIGWDLASRHDSSSAADSSPIDGGILAASESQLDVDEVALGGWTRTVGSVVFNSNSRKETVTMNFAIYMSRNASSAYCNLAGTAVRTAG